MEFDAFNLRHLRAMAAVVRLGGASAASRGVGITQPAITQAIAKLEAQLDLALFARQPGGMTATEAALGLAPRIERALDSIGSWRVTMPQMRALLALAEHGSYPSASAATGLAQPSLHRAIADLALSLRRPLVERRGRGVALTGAGRRTVRGFRLARAELAAALSEIETLKGRESGRIAIGAMPLSRAKLLPAACAAFHRDNPGVRLAILEGSFGELIEPLRDGEIDLTIGALRDPPPGDDIEQRALFEDRPVVIGRKGHPLARAGAPLQRLSEYPWIVPAKSAPLRTQWERLFEGCRAPPPDVPIECGSVITIRQILMETDFLTLLSPDQVAVELEAGWLEIVAQTPPELKRVIGVSTRAGWRPTPLQVRFLATLDEQVNRP